jgi:hypothetical protein
VPKSHEFQLLQVGLLLPLTTIVRTRQCVPPHERVHQPQAHEQHRRFIAGAAIGGLV